MRRKRIRGADCAFLHSWAFFA